MIGIGGFWGIDVAETGLKAVKVARHRGALVIQDVAIVPYSEITTDTEVRKEDLCHLALQQLLPRIGKSDVVVGIPSENVLSRFISLPPVERRRIHDIVQYEARQQIPFDLNEVIWDYQRVRKELVPGEEIDIGLFAVRKEHVYNYLDQVKPLAGNLKALQTSPLAAYSLARLDVAPEEPLILVDIGAKTTDLIVIEGEKFWMRNLRVAGNNFTQAIQRKFNITFEDAENVKKHMARSRHRARIFEVLTPVAQELVNEIQRSIGYYKSLSRETKFGEILVFGDCMKLYGLQRFMVDRLQYRIHHLEELKTVEIDDSIREQVEKNLSSLAAAIGLAMQAAGRRAVNIDLLPEDFVIRRELAAKRSAAVAGVALIWLALGGLWFGQGRGLDKIQQAGRHAAPVLEQAEQLNERFRQARAKMGMSKVQNLLDLDQGRQIWGEMLKGFANAIPGHIYIDSVSIVAGGAELDIEAEGAFDQPDYMPGMGFQGREKETQRVLTFTAFTDTDRGEEALGRPFKEALEEATIFPEKVKLFEEDSVRIGNITVVQPQRERPGYRSRGGGLRAREEEPSRETLILPTEVRERSMFRVNVSCRIYSEEHLRAQRAGKKM